MLKQKCNNDARSVAKRNQRRGWMLAMLMLTGSVILIAGFIGAFIKDNLIAFLAYTVALVVWIFVIALLASWQNKANLMLSKNAYGNETIEKYTGLFGELWDEFEKNQFDLIIDGIRTYSEAHNGTIELGILNSGHEFHVVIDEEALYMVMDEESETPDEEEIPLSEMADIGVVFLVIREFVERDF